MTKILHFSEPSCPHQNATSAFDRNYMHSLTKCMQIDKQWSYFIWAVLFILIHGRMNFIHWGPNAPKKAISVTNCWNVKVLNHDGVLNGSGFPVTWTPLPPSWLLAVSEANRHQLISHVHYGASQCGKWKRKDSETDRGYVICWGLLL